MKARGASQRGFTLIELLLAAFIIAGLAAATGSAISQSLRAQSSSRARQEAMSRASAAAELIARDVQNVIRDGDLYDALLRITDGGTDRYPSDELLLFASASRPARSYADQNEGGVYEVQVRLRPPEFAALSGTRTEAPPGNVLWRRLDPIPDEVVDGGGVAFAVADGIAALSIEGFDGESWYPSWDSDRDGYPHAVRITVTALARAGTGRTREAVARKVVAIDRVPIPFVTVEAADSSDENGEGSE